MTTSRTLRRLRENAQPSAAFVYFRVKASLASIASAPGNPAARSAAAAGLSAPFSHGSFAGYRA